MPEPRWLYLMALLYFPRVSTGVTRAEAMAEASHDRLPRMLHGPWSGHTRLDLALRALCTVVEGYRIVDDTVVEKPSARRVGEATGVWSSQQRQVVFRVSAPSMAKRGSRTCYPCWAIST